MSLFANYVSDGQGGSGATEMQFNAGSTDATLDHTLDIYTSSQGSNGSKVSIHKSALLSALTLTGAKGINQTWSTTDNSSLTAGELAGGSDVLTLAVSDAANALTLSQVSSGVFEKALENVVFLRAQTGGGLSRLSFAAESLLTQETNMRSALGRIEDVDIAAEAANLSKYTILMQASAAMVAQANSSNDVALMLLR
jgi:flagellin